MNTKNSSLIDCYFQRYWRVQQWQRSRMRRNSEHCRRVGGGFERQRRDVTGVRLLLFVVVVLLLPDLVLFLCSCLLLLLLTSSRASACAIVPDPDSLSMSSSSTAVGEWEYPAYLCGDNNVIGVVAPYLSSSSSSLVLASASLPFLPPWIPRS